MPLKLRCVIILGVFFTPFASQPAFAADWSIRGSSSKLNSIQIKLKERGLKTERRYKSIIVKDTSRAQLASMDVQNAQLTVPVKIAQDPLISEADWAAWDGFMGLDEGMQVGRGKGAIVAVVDTGAELSHPDLKNNLWTNPGETAGNGVDDDRNGYIDDIHGVSVRDGGVPEDEYGHGTHVSGTIAATLNGEGTNGIAPEAQLMVVQSLDEAGNGTSSDVAQGIRYAIANGADIINLSIVARTVTPEDQQVVDEAERAGVLIVGAAGNDGEDISNRPNSPASLDNQNLVNVASASNQGALSSFSNYGAANVEVAAFGEDIPSTYLGGRYAMLTGTSMATPMVSGVAAVLAGLYKNRGAEEWRQAIVKSATPTTSLKNAVSSGGVVNLADAINWEAARAGGAQAKKSVRFRTVSVLAKKVKKTFNVKVRWELSGGGAPDIIKLKATLKGKIAYSKGKTISFSKLKKGRHTINLKAYDRQGELRASKSFKIRLG